MFKKTSLLDDSLSQDHQNKENILFILQKIDLANGYVYSNLDNKEVLNSIATQHQYKIYDEFQNINNVQCDDDDE